MGVGQTRFGIPCWGIGEFTTHVRTHLSRDWDVHWGYGLLTHGHVNLQHKGALSGACTNFLAFAPKHRSGHEALSWMMFSPNLSASLPI